MKNYNQTSENNQDSGALSYPLSFLHNGYIDWYSASLNNRGILGIYWSLRSASTNNSNNLYLYDLRLNSQSSDERGDGMAVRCVSNTEWSGGLAPDSICPKGWQLPTYTGDKSFTTLINTSYSMKYSESEYYDSGLLSNPLSFPRNGYFGWYYGGSSIRGIGGHYWSLRSYSTTGSNRLYFYDTSLNPQSNDNRGIGFAVRCVATSQILHHSH